MKKLFLLTLLSFFMYGENLKVNMTKEEMVTNIVESERRNLPIEIDKIAEITNINLMNLMVIDTIEINSEEDQKIKKLIKTNEGLSKIINEYYERRAINFCNNERTRMLINNKIIFAAEFIEKTTKRTMGHYTVDEKDCIKLEKERKKPSL